MHRCPLGAVLAICVLFAAAVAGAQAAATPVWPVAGARIASWYPTFTWTIPTNETSTAIYIADSPDRDASGFFLDPNVVLSAYFSGETEWLSPTGLYARHYWWMIGSWSEAAQTHYWSPVADFTVLPSLSRLSLGVQWFRSLRLLHVTARWWSNVDWIAVRLRILRRGKVLSRQTQSEHSVVDLPGSTLFAWTKPRRIKRGTRLTLEVTAFAKGVKSSRRLVVRAP
jgi:hypothetical protein